MKRSEMIDKLVKSSLSVPHTDVQYKEMEGILDNAERMGMIPPETKLAIQIGVYMTGEPYIEYYTIRKWEPEGSEK